ncbi:MAG TPA: hypothetical protein DEQ38_00710 [Elusimicrobia bacterium]|nr:MAG: hypothetical protein A2089_09750 [Elusimicrobia bacterium GWD2_63_28]HCC46633.1 hypothetical protein [Elusimicrobiota bacterium]
MKILLLILLAALPAGAEWGGAENAAAGELLRARAEISVIGETPLLEMLAARDSAALPLEIGGRKFLASVVFDADWETWFTLKPAGDGLASGAWKETSLAAGAVYKYKDLVLKLKEQGGVVYIASSSGEKMEVTVGSLFDLLYAKSAKVTFGGAVTYAVFRNLEPLTESEGTVALRSGSDGLYYYSLTPDRQIASYPRWLLAVNGVLYGLRLDAASLQFVSKPIELSARDLPAERARAR